MEGAGASIVSDAAEHATRGMDSAHEEPETSNVSETVEEPKLPSAVQDCLEGKAEPISTLPDLSMTNSREKRPKFRKFIPRRELISTLDEEPGTSNVSETGEEPKLPSAFQDLKRRLEVETEFLFHWLIREFREFFPSIAAPPTIKGWRNQVRVRVLEAIGSCNTFEVLNVIDLSQLTAREWEIVLRGFMSSTNLREINVRVIQWSSDEAVESFCLQLGRILNSSSVTGLTIRGCRLSARCWLNLASGLRGNCESKLQRLDIKNAWKDSSAVKHVADMINSFPLLQTLRLCVNSKMDDEAVGMLSQALIQSSSLKDLRLDNLKWGAALLLKALAGDDGNRSIERILLGKEEEEEQAWFITSIRTSFPFIRSLKEVELDNLRMRPKEWQQLGEVIRDKAIATTIYVGYALRGDEDEWKSIEALACAASSDVKDPILELLLKPDSVHDYELSPGLLNVGGRLKCLT